MKLAFSIVATIVNTRKHNENTHTHRESVLRSVHANVYVRTYLYIRYAIQLAQGTSKPNRK